MASSAKPEVEIPSDGVLNLKLNYPLQDRSQDNNPFAALAALDPTYQMPIGLNDILQAIDEAKEDDKVKGIVLDLTAFQSAMLSLQK